MINNIILDENIPCEILTNINLLVDYVYSTTINKLKSKFHCDKFERYNIIYLNPYLRSIYIIKLSFLLIEKIKPVNVINLNYKETKGGLYASSPPLKIINNIKKLLSYLIHYNGEIEFKTCILGKVQFEDTDYDYKLIDNWATKFNIDKSYIKKLNMFDENYYYRDFMLSIYLLHKNMCIYQCHMTREEEYLIKKIIKLHIINYINKRIEKEKLKEIDKIINDIGEDENEDENEDEELPNFLISSSNNHDIIFDDFGGVISVYNIHMNEIIKIRGRIKNYEIADYELIQSDRVESEYKLFENLINLIKNYYGYVLYINPNADTFNNDITYLPDYFDYIDCNYSYYKKLIKNIKWFS